MWETHAKKAGVKLHSLASSSGLAQVLEKCGKNTSFYIDQNLGEDELKGEDLAKELFDYGYKKIYLQTGYSPENFAHLDFVKGITGKAPPWNSEVHPFE